MAEVVSKAIFETGDAQSSIQGLINSIEKYQNAVDQTNSAAKQPFKDSAKNIQDFNKELSNGVKVYQKIENTAQGYKDEIKRLNTLLQDLTRSQSKFIAAGKYDVIQKDIAKVKSRLQELKSVQEDNTKAGNGFAKVIQNIGATMAAYFAIDTIINLGKQIFNVTAEFQKFEAVLTTSLGSNSAAERAMNMIADFAATTPFSVAELTDSYVKLASRGIRATAEQMENLGDIASSTGKSFDQLTEAVLDSLSGENERLKEFGIQAQKTGQTTQYTFKGVTTEVKNTKEAILAYMVSLGDLNGVQGSSEAISKTLTGQISNLGDAFDRLLLTVGNQQEGIFGSTISLFTRMTERATFLLSSVDQLGEKLASEDVSKFAEKIEADFGKIAEKTKAAGGDVAAVLRDQAFLLQRDLEEKRGMAQAQLDIAKENYDFLAKADDFLLGRTTNKEAAAKIAAEVKKAEGELAAIDDALRVVLERSSAKPGYDAEAAKKAEDEAKKRAAALKAAEKELQRELEALEKQAAQARLDMLDKNSKEYQVELLAQRSKEIGIIEDSLKEAERKAGKDGKLDTKQEDQLSILRQAAQKQYNEAIYNIELAASKKLLDLQADSHQKELDQINQRYDAEIFAANVAKDRVLAAALEQARERELIAARFNQQESDADQGETLAIEVATQYTYSESDDPVNIERDKQEKILAIQIEYAKKRMENALLLSGQEGEIRRLELKNYIDELEKQQKEIGKLNQADKFDILELLGVKDEDKDAVRQAFNEVIGFVSDFTRQQLDLANEVLASRREEVKEKEGQLDREIELNKLGFASNVETRRAELEEAKKARSEAIADQQKAQKAQNTIDTLQQLTALGTSAANIIKGFSAIPIVGLPLGIAAVTAMFVAFASAKSRATAATKAEKGLSSVGGKRHAQGGNRFVSIDNHNDVLEIEEGERIVNRKSNSKYWEWLEAINNDDMRKFERLAFNYTLEEMPIRPRRELAQEIEKKAEIQREIKDKSYNNEAVLKELQQLREEVKGVRSNTNEKEEIIETPTETIHKKGSRTWRVKKQA